MTRPTARPPHPPANSPRAGHVLLVAAALSLGSLAACRGDSGPRLSEWVKRADEVCTESQRDADMVRPVLFTPSLPDLLRRSADLSKKEASRLRELDRPAEKRQETRDYVGTLDERNNTLVLLATSVEQLAPDTSANTEQLAALTEKAADQARALGLQKCRAGVDLSVTGPESTGTSPPPTAAGGPSPPPSDTEIGTEDGGGEGAPPGD